MNIAFKSLFLCALIALSATGSDLSANAKLKNFAQMTVQALRTYKKTSAFACIAGALLAHKAFKFQRSHQLLSAKVELAALESELREKTVAFAVTLDLGHDDTIWFKPADQVNYNDPHNVKIINEGFNHMQDANNNIYKELSEDDIAQRRASRTQENNIIRGNAEMQEQLQKVNKLALKIKSLDQDSPQTYKEKLLYIRETEIIVRQLDMLFIKYPHQSEIKEYFYAMTGVQWFKPDIRTRLTADFCKKQNAALLHALKERVRTNNRLGNEEEIIAKLEVIVALGQRHQNLVTEIARLEAGAPYPLWRKIFGPTK